MIERKIHLASLGCAKNQIDSEIMIGRLIKEGCTIVQKPSEANVIIINTCSFIESAADESIDTILELSVYKKKGACQRLIVAGCLPERYRDQISESLPEVDFFLGTGAFDEIVSVVKGSKTHSRCTFPDPDLIDPHADYFSRHVSSRFSAYIKIAEGCNRQCSYCIIPKLRGRQKSRLPEDIIREAQHLIKFGAKELILVAQDTTSYCRDLNNGFDLNFLLKKLAAISKHVWIRLLYGHPDSITEPLIKTIVETENICSYFDIPIQHASSTVLKRMNRHYTRNNLVRLFKTVRAYSPEACLRTTLISGFPGETENEFQTLLKFIQDIRFDHLGVFLYSDAKDILSHNIPNHVPKKVAKKRLDMLMSSQMKISLQNNQKHMGKKYKVLIEEAIENGIYTGRTYFQAPEVDGMTYVDSRKLNVGDRVDVKIKEAFEYDLRGRKV